MTIGHRTARAGEQDRPLLLSRVHPVGRDRERRRAISRHWRALYLSVREPGKPPPDRWTTLRLFLMPFCVSSFAALVKDKGFVLIFSPRPGEILTAVALCALLCAVVAALKRSQIGARNLPTSQSDAVAPGETEVSGSGSLDDLLDGSATRRGDRGELVEKTPGQVDRRHHGDRIALATETRDVLCGRADRQHSVGSDQQPHSGEAYHTYTHLPRETM